MRILHKDINQGDVKVKVEHADDLWYLQKLVEAGDIVRGKTMRKIKLGKGGDRKQRTERKNVFLEVEVEDVEFHESSTVLRVKGQTVAEEEDVPKGSYHTFNVDEGTVIELHKEWWSPLDLKHLDEAKAATGRDVLIVCHNREEAVFGQLTSRGVEELSTLSGSVAKKRVEDQAQGNFYEEVAGRIEEYVERLDPRHVVLASPSFWKEYVMPHLSDQVKNITTQATCSNVERGLHEVVNRPELEHVLEEDRTRREQGLLGEIKEAIAKDRACYGIDDAEEKAQIGAVELLLVSEEFLRNDRDRVSDLMQQVEEMDGEVHIVSDEEVRTEVDNLGGVAGTLRWEA